MNVQFGPILVVEDTQHLLELLEVTLRFKGYPVITARDGEEALAIMENERPSLVITDILMPKMDGYALAFNLRKDPRTSRIPIIFISATYLTQDDKNFALQLGGVRFIEKPIDTEDFLLTVAEILTQGPGSQLDPMPARDFYVGYRERLENKLAHKITQIQRTERLLKTLPDHQRPAFEALLKQVMDDHDKIQSELERLYQTLEELRSAGKTLQQND